MFSTKKGVLIQTLYKDVEIYYHKLNIHHLHQSSFVGSYKLFCTINHWLHDVSHFHGHCFSRIIPMKIRSIVLGILVWKVGVKPKVSRWKTRITSQMTFEIFQKNEETWGYHVIIRSSSKNTKMKYTQLEMCYFHRTMVYLLDILKLQRLWEFSSNP